jgi:hypothetical protein
MFNDFAVDYLDAVSQCLDRSAAADAVSEFLPNALRCHRGRLSATRMTAHPITHNQQGPDIVTGSIEAGGVLIFLSHTPWISSLSDKHLG